MISALKFFHISALAVWCAGLLLLPVLLHRADNPLREGEAARMRMFSHHAYNAIISPAAVIATVAGGVLLFARWVFDPWMFLKLALIGFLVLMHTYVGHCVTRLGEKGYVRPILSPTALFIAGISIMCAILFLVLAKPQLNADVMPEWLRTPVGGQLFFPAVPN
ncbi:MAG: CopD family protein [Beijerinckiaceae bacterium]|nr:CopD family protein [Beijerinckiaceae bacterium]